MMWLGTFGQEWTKTMTDGSSIYEAKAAFDAHWGDQGYIKGRGYKQFQRWFNFWEPRLYPSGEWDQLDSQAYLDAVRLAQPQENRDGGDWQSLGLDDWTASSYGPGNGRVNCIAFDPSNDQVVFAGTPAGGLWKSTNNGQDWSPLTDHLPTLGVSGIVVSEDDSDVIYIATGDSDASDTYSLGIFKSIDGGETWTTAGLTFLLSQSVRTHRLMAVPGSPDTIFAATTDGLYKTINGGVTWIKVISAHIRDLEFKPGDVNTIYASSTSFYVSTDGGDNFTVMNDGLPASGGLARASIAVTPDEPEWIYFLAAVDNTSSYEGLYRSTDSGGSWQLRSDSPNLLGSADDGGSTYGQAWYDMEIAVSPTDANSVIVGAVNLWESSNGGLSWGLNAFWTWPPSGTNYVHADIHNLDYNNGTLWCGSDGGVFRSTNEGGSFTDMSEGLSISQFYRLGVYAGNSSRVSCGAQDCGTNLMNGNSWTHVLGADGMETIIHPDDQNIMWACTQNGGLQKSTNGGSNFSWSASGISEDGAWTTPYILSPVNPDVMYAGFENVWRSTDGADSWQVISDFSNEQLRSVAMGLFDPNTIYAASYGNLYKTSDAGGDWENISFGLANEAITYLAVDPLDVDRIWVTFAGFEEGEKVYLSENGGDTWQNISGNLPNCPVNCIVYDTETDDGIYIGTDLGVYYQSEELASWHPFMDGLPNVIVSELEINYNDQKIFAATFGRGLWSSEVWQSPTEAPEADIELNQQYVCVGNSLQFFDASQENAPGWEWTFEGGLPASSSDQNPVISYDESGTYDVTLEVSNSVGPATYFCENCVIVYDSFGTELPLIEGFENTMDLAVLSWFAVGDDEGNGWEITDMTGYESSQSIWIENHLLDVENVYEMYSQPFDLSTVPEGEEVHFRFDAAFTTLEGETDDRLRLYLTTSCGQNWSLKEQWQSDEITSIPPTISPFVPSSSSEWQEFNYDLNPADHQQSVAFKLWFRNDNGNNIFVDNINIWSGDVHVGELEDIASVVVYPNPFEGSSAIKINSVTNQQLTLRIFDSSGRLVIEKSLNVTPGETTHDLWMGSFSAGIYQLELSDGNGKISEKLVRY